MHAGVLTTAFRTMFAFSIHLLYSSEPLRENTAASWRRSVRSIQTVYAPLPDHSQAPTARPTHHWAKEQKIFFRKRWKKSFWIQPSFLLYMWAASDTLRIRRVFSVPISRRARFWLVWNWDIFSAELRREAVTSYFTESFSRLNLRLSKPTLRSSSKDAQGNFSLT